MTFYIIQLKQNNSKNMCCISRLLKYIKPKKYFYKYFVYVLKLRLF